MASECEADDAGGPPLCRASDHYVPNWYCATRKEEKQIRVEHRKALKAQDELEMEEERKREELVVLEERKREELVVLCQDVRELDNKLKATEIEKQKLEQKLLDKQEALEQKVVEKQKLEKEYQDMSAAVITSRRKLRAEKAKFKACQQEEEQCVIEQAIAESLTKASQTDPDTQPNAVLPIVSSSASVAVDELTIGWTEHVDPKYQVKYWFNATLGVSQWERPVNGKGHVPQRSRADLHSLDQKLVDFEKKHFAAEKTTTF